MLLWEFSRARQVDFICIQSLWCRLAADISAAVLLGIHLNTYDKDIMFAVLPLYVPHHSQF